MSIFGGALSGYLCGKLGAPDQIYDDEEHWDDLAEDKPKIGVESL
jgi:hypothetical protein